MGAERIQAKDSLIERVNYYLRINRITTSDFARILGYDRTTMSKYLNGKYNADPTKIEEVIYGYMERLESETDGTVTPFPSPQPRETPFFESADAKAVIGLCTECQDNAVMGMIVGKSGYGKSYSLGQYLKMPKVVYISCDEIMGVRDVTRAIERELGLAYKGTGSSWERIQDIVFFLHSNPGYLLIIDEADKLISKHTQKKMEALRSIFDQSKVGLVLAGEPKLKSLVHSYLARVENRIECFYELGGLQVKEVDRYLAGHQVEPEALLELRKRASTGHRACFRLLDRTMRNISRILADSDSGVITLEVIQAASDMMAL